MPRSHDRPKPLTLAQGRVVRVLGAADGPLCAYDLCCSLATLRALSKRGVVRCANSGELGSMAWPRVALRWELTEARRDG